VGWRCRESNPSPKQSAPDRLRAYLEVDYTSMGPRSPKLKWPLFLLFLVLHPPHGSCRGTGLSSSITPKRYTLALTVGWGRVAMPSTSSPLPKQRCGARSCGCCWQLHCLVRGFTRERNHLSARGQARQLPRRNPCVPVGQRARGREATSLYTAMSAGWTPLGEVSTDGGMRFQGCSNQMRTLGSLSARGWWSLSDLNR
jgi:hypothetical protein